MSTRTVNISLVATCLLLAASGVHSQQTTERYIPIGESPGVTADETVAGTITEVDYESHSMQVRGSKGLKTVRMIESTRYYLDRTKRKRSNQSATFSDCKVGREVEVKYYADGSVDWVKIEST